MCYVCCEEFKGWCKSFTRTERLLSVLQALLLAVLIGFLVFLILHLLVCSEERAKQDRDICTNTSTTDSSLLQSIETVNTSSTVRVQSTTIRVRTTTLSPDIECTWQPSKKTQATIHYYWTPRISYETPSLNQQDAADQLVELDYSDDENEDNPDGTDAPQRYKGYVAALVKLKLPADVTYGCILTKVTRFWTLTAASCIESIEEMDSLDSFFITETYGEVKQGLSHALADVRIHPLYQGTNRSYDLAALRSSDDLAPSIAHLLKLPSLIEYFLVGIGERFIILGYGGYRTIDSRVSGRRLRQVATYTVSLAQCGAGESADAWAPRHLTGGEAARACAWCGAAALCAGAPAARAPPCAFCSGTPLLRAGRLYGVMSDNRHCGVSCEPSLYVNIAALRDWIESVVD